MPANLLAALVRLALRRGYRDPRDIIANKPLNHWWTK